MATVIIQGKCYCCGTCTWWKGRIGDAGQCTIPPSSSTINCGTTFWNGLCEQWNECGNMEVRDTAIRHRHRVEWLKRHAWHRALWWEDNALSGIDPYTP